MQHFKSSKTDKTHPVLHKWYGHLSSLAVAWRQPQELQVFLISLRGLGKSTYPTNEGVCWNHRGRSEIRLAGWSRPKENHCAVAHSLYPCCVERCFCDTRYSTRQEHSLSLLARQGAKAMGQWVTRYGRHSSNIQTTTQAFTLEQSQAGEGGVSEKRPGVIQQPFCKSKLGLPFLHEGAKPSFL